MDELVANTRLTFPRLEEFVIKDDVRVKTYPFLENPCTKDVTLMTLIMRLRPYAAGYGSRNKCWETISQQCQSFKDKNGDTPLNGVSMSTVRSRYYKYIEVAKKRQDAGEDDKVPASETAALLEKLYKDQQSCSNKGITERLCAQRDIILPAIQDGKVLEFDARENLPVAISHLSHDQERAAESGIDDIDVSVETTGSTTKKRRMSNEADTANTTTKHAALSRIDALLEDILDRSSVRDAQCRDHLAYMREQAKLDRKHRAEELKLQRDEFEHNKRQSLQEAKMAKQHAQNQHELLLCLINQIQLPGKKVNSA